MSNGDLSAKFGSPFAGGVAPLRAVVLEDAQMAGDGKDEGADDFVPAPDPVTASPEPGVGDEAGDGVGNEAGDGVGDEAGDGGPAKEKAPVALSNEPPKSVRNTVTAAKKDKKVVNLREKYHGAVAYVNEKRKNGKRSYTPLTELDLEAAAGALAHIVCGPEMSRGSTRVVTHALYTIAQENPDMLGCVGDGVGPAHVKTVLLTKKEEQRGGPAAGNKKQRGSAAGGRKKKDKGVHAGRMGAGKSAAAKSTEHRPSNPFKPTSTEDQVKDEYYSKWVLLVLTNIPKMNLKGDMDAHMQLSKLQQARGELFATLVKQYVEATGKAFEDNKYRTTMYLHKQVTNPRLFASSMLEMAEQFKNGQIPHNKKEVKRFNIKPSKLGCNMADIAKAAKLLRAQAEAHPEETSWAEVRDILEFYLLQLGGIQTGRLLTDPGRKKGEAQDLNTRLTVANYPDRCKQLVENFNKTSRLGMTPEEVEACGKQWTLMTGLFEWCVSEVRGSKHKCTVTLDSFKNEWPGGIQVAVDAVDIAEMLGAAIQGAAIQGAAGGAAIQGAEMQDAEMLGAAGGAAIQGVLDVLAPAGATGADAGMQDMLEEEQVVRRNPTRPGRFVAGAGARTVIQTPKRLLVAEQDLSGYEEDLGLPANKKQKRSQDPAKSASGKKRCDGGSK